MADTKIMSKLFFLALTMGLTGCATIVSKSCYAIPVKANEPGAIVKVYDRENVLVTWVKAPGTVVLAAHNGMYSSASYRFVFEKPGFENDESIVNAKVDPCYWINFVSIYSAVLGLLFVDPMSGAMWAFDENVTIMGFLQPKDGRQPVRGDFGETQPPVRQCGTGGL